MQGPQDVTPTTSPTRTRTPRRRRRGSLIAILGAGAGLVFAACGSSESAATLNTGKVERAIAQSSLAQRGQRPRVNCPSTVPQEKGLQFSCMAVVGSVSTRFVVIEQDESGHVHYEAP